MFRAIEMRAKAHAFIGNFSQFGKAEDLVTAGIGENGAVPGHEFMETAQFADQLMPWAKIEVISVSENDLGAEFFQRFIAQAFYRCLRAHRHEYRRFNRSVRSGQPSAARASCVGI